MCLEVVLLQASGVNLRNCRKGLDGGNRATPGRWARVLSGLAGCKKPHGDEVLVNLARDCAHEAVMTTHERSEAAAGAVSG